VSWFYGWSGDTSCTGTEEFVPQVWGSWKKLNWVPAPSKVYAAGHKVILGFNEPDMGGQSNLTVDEALSLWPDFDQPGIRVGSPATATNDWFPPFMDGVAQKNLRVDFIAIHWYGWDAGSCNNVSSLEGKVQWAEQWNKPIWITEWSCRLQSATVTRKFFNDALAMFKKHPLVERYSWFLSRSDGDFAGAALIDGNGNPTDFGKDYIAAPAFH
jgi:hypothetical protein